MHDRLGSRPIRSKVDSPGSKFVINPGELVVKVNHYIGISGVVGTEFGIAADRRNVPGFECFEDMWLRAARYEKSYRKTVVANRRNEEMENLLLDLVILAFV
jgi:hypothetical protein